MALRKSQYYRELTVPIRFIKTETENKPTEIIKEGNSRLSFKNIGYSVLAIILILIQSQIFTAFEAHIINVTAHICNYSETRTMGYWKNHPNVYLPHLPQYLGAPGGDEEISTQQEVNQVFLDYNLSMRNKLRGQLLSMKFNIAHFGIGDYLVESEGKTLNQIVAEADDLLRDPSTPDSVLEEMKDLLDYLNNLHQIRFCSTLSGPEPAAIIDVVINEFLPNPVGSDSGPMPGGEWIELYNKGNEIDVAGWVLYDANDNHELPITVDNTNMGNTIIGTGEFLVVYRNGDPDFTLNNVGGDTVRLYDGEINSGANLADSHTYVVDALEGKSFARILDGSDDWVDPIPTPGEPNILGGEDIVFGPALAEPDEEINEEIQNEISYEEIISGTTEETILEENAGPQEQPEQPVIEETPITEAAPAIIEEMPVVEEPTSENLPEPAPETNSESSENTTPQLEAILIETTIETSPSPEN